MKSAVSAIIASLATSAFACSPNQNFDVRFKSNSSQLESTQILRLASWVVKIKTEFANHDLLQISGSAEAGEKNPKNLARQRADAVAEYFKRTRYDRATIQIENHVYDIPRINGEDFMRTEIMMTPLPSHPCSG
jgi:hypothetical protein